MVFVRETRVAGQLAQRLLEEEGQEDRVCGSGSRRTERGAQSRVVASESDAEEEDGREADGSSIFGFAVDIDSQLWGDAHATPFCLPDGDDDTRPFGDDLSDGDGDADSLQGARQRARSGPAGTARSHFAAPSSGLKGLSLHMLDPERWTRRGEPLDTTPPTTAAASAVADDDGDDGAEECTARVTGARRLKQLAESKATKGGSSARQRRAALTAWAHDMPLGAEKRRSARAAARDGAGRNAQRAARLKRARNESVSPPQAGVKRMRVEARR